MTGYLFWRDTPLFGAIEGQTLTWRFQIRGPIQAPSDIAIIAIDDASMEPLKRWPLPRIILADAITRLAAADVRVIGLDLLLLGPDPTADAAAAADGDTALAEAIATIRTVLPLAFTFDPGKEMDIASIHLVRQVSLPVIRHAGTPGLAIDATGLLAPIAPLREHADLGHVNVLPDQDGILRQLSLAVEVGGRYVPSFMTELARHFRGLTRGDAVVLPGRGLSLGEKVIPTDPYLQAPVFYYGPPKTIPTFSLRDLLAGQVPAQALAGRVALIGATATGVGDTFATPFSHNFPGVEALATATANIMHDQVLRHDATVLRWDAIAIIGACLATFLLGYLPFSVAPAGAAVATILLLMTVAQWAFQVHLIWLNLTFPTLGILLSSSVIAASRVIAERRGRRDMERQRSNLARYHSPLVADLLARGPAEATEHRQMAAILFVDMAGFTARCERLQPEAAARFLRDFHGCIERAVLAHGGMLDQFLGDGAMVIFGIRGASPEDPIAALTCARHLIEECENWSRKLVAEGQEPLVIRVGIHYGMVMISRLGGSMQMHFSAAGDTVNVAARLEAFGRSAASIITISGPVAAAVQQAGRKDLLAGFAELPPQPIRGRSEKLSVWTLEHQPL
ncbi:MAG TPA: adenylate/guanylate cyclase domain-containing protein [Ferrovibrio sp.]|uniref:CHASE2 domain-containing protein n=1 Tax=Ferrovibrio sp. TaxID=1917215 RepID=UPI002ED34849